MASSYSTLLRLELMADGEKNNTWGPIANTQWQLNEEAIAGMETIAVTGGSKTLTATNGASDESRPAILKFTGTLTSNQTIVVPSTSKHWIVWNTTSGGYTLTVKTSGGSGVEIPINAKTFVFCDGTDVLEVLSYVMKQGKHTIWIPATGLTPAVTNGCAAATVTEVSAGKPPVIGCAFDASTAEYAEFLLALPKSWNKSSVTFVPYWSANDTSTDGVAWTLQAVSLDDSDPFNTAYGTAVTVTDNNQGASYDVNIGAESTAVSVAGSPTSGELQAFRVGRDVSNGSDDMAADAILVGIKMLITISSANDA